MSYPKQTGDSPWSIIDVDGPNPYVEVTPPTPPSTDVVGGQAIFPSDFGLQSFHIILAQASNDGKYKVVVIPIQLMGDDSFNEARLEWIDLATGAQVAAGTDLSASSVRLLAIGN